MRQVFHRTVHGGVAGRDVVNIDLGNCSEYEAQHHFHACTGITCSRQARKQLILLADHHDFRFQELRRAIRQGALVWRREAQHWSISAPWADYAVAIVLLFSGIALALGVAGLAWARLGGVHALLATFLTVAAFMFIAGLLQLQFVLPHRIARRAIAALRGHVQQGTRPSDV